jgi:hypothetical protein
MAMVARAIMAIGEAGDAAGKGNQNLLLGEGACPPFFMTGLGCYAAGAAAGLGSGLSCFLDQEM